MTAEAIRIVAILAQPFMPRAGEKLLDLLGIAGNARDLAHIESGARLSVGSVLPAPEAVFPRFVEPAA